MWDKDDHFLRWVQGLCIIPLVLWIVFACYLLNYSDSIEDNYSQTAVVTPLVLAIYLTARCLWYAVTGRHNVNRDDY